MNKIFLTLFAAMALAGQGLTPAQKEFDFRALADIFATSYAPLDWKKELLNADARQLKPWLDRVAQTKTDLEFYEVCIDYANSLQDTHVSFRLPSDFSAQLGFFVDVYDGALLIDSINRTQLPIAAYPFVAGDELVSIDGVDAKVLVERLSRYIAQGNPKARQRLSAQLLTGRGQSLDPNVPSLPDASTVVIQRQSGVTATYEMKWVKRGTPLAVGPVRPPRILPSAKEDYMKPLRELQHSGVLDPHLLGVVGYGSRNPIFLGGVLGSDFRLRLGAAAADAFFSGTFRRGDLTIGFIRIPSFSPASQAAALQQFETEIAYMNANTDGLIVDDMRNPGGNLCYAQELVRRLTPTPFEATGFRTRPLWGRVNAFYSSMIAAKGAGAPREVIEQYEAIYREILSAAQQGRTLTEPVNLCAASIRREPWAGPDGDVLAYEKPVMVLIDEFSTSSADSFASMMQDSGRAILFGYRTNGAGGNNVSFAAGPYSQGSVGVTIALQTRAMRANPGYPTSIYTENVGVHPEVIDDYMTKENLLRGGAPFVADFLEAMDAYIRQRK